MTDTQLGTIQGADAGRRALDVVLASVALLVAIPVILVSAMGSLIFLRAWPFFTQQRIGHDGEPFSFVKVRTLPVGVPSYIDKHQLDMSEVPVFCQLLRRLHLDELPQLLLVIRGRMSLVGPRPEMAYLHRHLPEDFQRLRTSIRPGCTGLWQVSESCADMISEAPEYDRYYVANRSIRLDLWVLYRTALKMAGWHRPVMLDDLPSWIRRADEPHHVVDLVRAERALTAQVAAAESYSVGSAGVRLRAGAPERERHSARLMT